METTQVDSSGEFTLSIELARQLALDLLVECAKAEAMNGGYAPDAIRMDDCGCGHARTRERVAELEGP